MYRMYLGYIDALSIYRGAKGVLPFTALALYH